MAKRKRYDDKFRASAVVMLEAAGYPEKKGALMSTAKHLGVPHNTLRAWFHAEHNPPPSELRQEKRKELSEMLRDEINGALGAMPDARLDASYRDLGTVLGILFDKLQLLQNKPTAILKLQEAIEAGQITPEQARERWPSLAEQLFNGAAANARPRD